MAQLTKLQSSLKDSITREFTSDFEDDSEVDQEKWTIELRRGNSVVYKEDRTNAISTTKTYGIFILLYAILTNFKNAGTLFFLAVTLIMLIDPDLSPYFRWIMAFPLLIFMIIHVVKVLVIRYIRKKQDEVVNNLSTRRAKPSGELEENVKWMNLKPGDIVYLKKEETCPADLILLDTSLPKNRDMICWLQTRNNDGFSDLTLKKATLATKVENGSTRKGNYPEYRKILSGKIEYDPPNATHKSFSGYIKLKKDPRAEPITYDNFIPRGSVLKNTEWIYGICAYTGNDTKTMYRSRRPITKGNYFDRLAEKFFVFGIVLVLVLSAICIIIFTSKKNDRFLNIEYPEGVSGKRFFTNVILHSPVIPIALYAIFDLIMAFRAIALERKFNQKNPEIKILDPSAIPNLGHVDYCLIDKTGTLTTANYRIRQVYTKSKFYQVDLNTLNQKIKVHKGNTNLSLMQTLSDQRHERKAPTLQTMQDVKTVQEIKTLQDVGEEGTHMHASSPIKPYKFKDDIESQIRFTSPDKLNTSGSPINKGQGTGEVLLFGNRARTEDDRDAILSPHEDVNLLLHTEQGLLTENADDKSPINFETQESVRPMIPKKRNEQNIEMTDKHKRNNFSDAGSLKRIEHEPFTPDSPNKKETSFGVTPRAMDDRSFLKEKLNENQYLHDCYIGHDRDLDQFARCLALCHAARSKYTDEKYVYESSHPEDLPLLELGAVTNKSFMVSNRPDNPSKYTVLEGDGVHDYKILGVNDFSYGRKRFSIVTKSGEHDPAVIYAKGTAFGMKSTLQLDDFEQTYYDALVTRLQNKGYKVVVLAARELEQEEADNFYKKYQSCKMSLYSQTDELEALAKEVETRLKLVGVVALEDELRPDAVETIQMFKDADIKTWMVTGDNQENALNICYLSRLINKNTEVYNCTFDNVENAKALIRSTLNNIKKHFSGDEEESPVKKVAGFKTIYTKKFDFAVSIDGDSLDLVFKDNYLKANFTFLCALASNVIGYRLSPSNKTALISMIKNGFKGAPTVLAIGDGHNDKLMLERADISLELRAGDDSLPVNSGDIQIKSLGAIKDLLLVEGRDISDKTEKVLHFMFYKAMVLGFPLFLYNLDSASTGSPLFDSMFIFLYSFLFTSIPTLIYGVCDRGESKEVLLAFPALYLDGKLKKGRAWLNFLIQSLVEGIVHGIVVYEIVTYAVQVTLSDNGLTPDLFMSSLIQFYALVTIVNLKLYGYFKTKKIIWAFSTVLSLVILLVYMFINNAAQFVNSTYLRGTQAIFDRGGSILSLFFVIVFCAMFSRLIKYVVAERWFRSWYNYYGSKSYEEAEDITNEKILATAIPPKDLGTIVKSAFKQPELMDPVVQQMLHPGDESLHSLGIRPWTLGFVDSRMEKQYKMVMVKIIANKFKYIYVILLTVFAGYIIGASILNEESSYTFSRLGVFLAFLVLGAGLFTPVYRAYYFEITFIFIVLVIAAKIAFDWTTHGDSSLGAALIPAAVAIVFNAYAFWLFLGNLAYYVVYIIRLIVLYTTDDYLKELPKFMTFYSLFSFALLIGSITVLISIVIYKFEKHQRSEHLANTTVGLQLTKSNDILSILLPKFIKEKISRLGDDKSLAEDQGEVTILFCDIMDFDKIIQYEGKNLVQILDHVFRAFDQLCGTYGVQKIETVGKTYMACAGLKSCEMGVAKEIVAIHQTRRILNLALDMDEFVKKVTYSNGIPMKLRIGVHYGRVIAGVIGYHKPQFSLIGDAVNTTSRVCTSKNPGQIRMSNEAYQKMMEAGGAGRSEIFFIPKTEEMKGKGDVKVHIVTRKATNTGFKKMIANAVKVNKDKHVFAVEGEGGETALANSSKSMANPNMFKDIKGNLRITKARIEEEIRKAETEKKAKDENNEDSDSDGEGEDDQDVALLKPNPFTLRFAPTANNRMIADFEEKFSQDQRVFGIRSILGLLAVYLIQTGLFIAMDSQYEEAFEASPAIIALRFIFAVALALLLVFYGTLAKKKLREDVTLFIFLFGTLVTILHGAWTLENDNYEYIEGVELMLIHSIAIHSTALNFVDSLRLTGGMTVIFFVAYGVKHQLGLANIFFFCIFAVMNLIHKYVRLTEEIKFYNNLRLRDKRKVEQSRLVGQLLPLHAAEIYFSDPTGRVDVSDEFHDVTILYADIKGFTDYSAEVEPKDVVTMLAALFTRFDKVCVKYNLYKVYTIGDCYVALSFFDASRRDPGKEVNNMVQMALSMIGIIREVRKEIKFEGLDMRIGLHTGTIIGGIVGTDIIRYDCWGRDVLIANAMESEGVKGNINVSESTRNLLEATYPGVYRFEPHKVVEMEKIQAKVPCYLLYSNDVIPE